MTGTEIKGYLKEVGKWRIETVLISEMRSRVGVLFIDVKHRPRKHFEPSRNYKKICAAEVQKRSFKRAAYRNSERRPHFF